MDIVGNIITTILLGVIFFYQRHKINSLETQIKSQKEILDGAKTFFDFFDLEKLKGYAEIREDKIRIEKEIELNKIRGDFEEKISKGEYATGILLKEFASVSGAFFDAFYKLPSIHRREVISRMGEGVLKQKMQESNRKLEETESPDLANLLLALRRSSERS